MSTHEKQETFLRDRVMEPQILSLIHAEKNSATHLAESWAEVLILGRGRFPEILLEWERVF